MSREHKLPPLGLSRPDAAMHLGMGISLFDKLVADGRLPRPRRADGRLIWSRLELEDAFADLPYHGSAVANGNDADNPFAAIRAKRQQRENTA